MIVHEIGHTIGFYHEQSRPDRDNYVRVKLYNAKSGTWPNFAKYSRDYIDTRGVEYDYGSIMHYRANAFSSNGMDTVIPIVAEGEEVPIIGQRLKLSKLDIAMARAMYHCDADTLNSTPTNCMDQTVLCASWANKGLCEKGGFVDFLTVTCPVSCGLCSLPLLLKSDPTPVTPIPTVSVNSVNTTLVYVRVETGVESDKVQIMTRRTEGSGQWSFGLVRSHDPSEPVYGVFNLLPGTGYDVVARAKSGDSKWSEFSEVVNFVTIDE